MDEEKYVENVDYWMRVLTLLTQNEVNLIKESWSMVRTDGLCEKIFYRMFTENRSMRGHFVGMENVSDEILTKNKIFQDHNDHVLNNLSTMVENIQNPKSWMQDILKTATIHRMSSVKMIYLTHFKSSFMDELKYALGEDFSPEKEELWDRVMDSVVGFMNQCLD